MFQPQLEGGQREFVQRKEVKPSQGLKAESSFSFFLFYFFSSGAGSRT